MRCARNAGGVDTLGSAFWLGRVCALGSARSEYQVIQRSWRSAHPPAPLWVGLPSLRFGARVFLGPGSAALSCMRRWNSHGFPLRITPRKMDHDHDVHPDSARSRIQRKRKWLHGCTTLVAPTM